MVSFGINNSFSASGMHQKKTSDPRLSAFTGQGGKGAGSIFGKKPGGMQATPPNGQGPKGPQKGPGGPGSAPGGIFAQNGANRPNGGSGGLGGPGLHTGQSGPGGAAGRPQQRKTFMG